VGAWSINTLSDDTRSPLAPECHHPAWMRFEVSERLSCNGSGVDFQ